jgi:hypothetical protein
MHKTGNQAWLDSLFLFVGASQLFVAEKTEVKINCDHLANPFHVHAIDISTML